MPYIFGICFYVYVDVVALHLWLPFLVVLIGISYLIQRFYPSRNYLKKAFYIVCTYVFLFVLANKTCYLYQATNNKQHYSHFIESGKQAFFATVTDIPVQTNSHTKLSLTIEGVEQNGRWHCTEGNVIAYLKKPLSSLTVGSVVYINSNFSYVNAPKNPNEFDYKLFLERKNIFHTVYANTGSTASSSLLNTSFSLSQIGTGIKSNIVSILRTSGLSSHAFSICSALLVGYDDEITNDVVQQFSHSGTLHILSVSGMHTGVLYSLLIWFFGLFDKYDVYKKTKAAFILVALWGFVAITGFSPAVMRAALMLSLILIGKMFYKQSNTYNTLLLSAFILLLINPYLLFDVGFQLSYLAVLGIVYLYPILQRVHHFNIRWVQWLWSSVLISIAATLFTLPIALYNFHQFPIWFIFSNLLIIPISMGIMIGALVLILVYKISFIKSLLVLVLNFSTTVMLCIAKLTDNPNYGFIDWIRFSKVDFIFCSVAIFLFLLFIYTKNYKHTVYFFSTLIVWCAYTLFFSLNQKEDEELIVFHIKQKSATVLKTKDSIFIVGTELTDNDINRYIKPYLLTYSNYSLRRVKTNYIIHHSRLITNCTNHATKILANTADYVIVSNNTPVAITALQKKKPTIIADCSNNYTFVKELKKQCAKAGVVFYSIKEIGALKIQL